MTTTKGKPAGSRAGNKYGNDFKVQYCSPAQSRFIQQLLDSRIHLFEIADATQVNKKHASRIIEQLLICPKKVEDYISEKQLSFIDLLMLSRKNAKNVVESALLFHRVDSVHKLTLDQAKALITHLVACDKVAPPSDVTVGAYKVGDIYYSVRKRRESERLFVVQYDPINKAWIHNHKVLATLTQANRLSLSDASAFGIATGSCVHCGRTLTLQKSVVAGMGKWCASHYN